MILVPIPQTGLPVVKGMTLSATAQAVVELNQSLYQAGGYHEPWIAYLAVEDNACVGTCAFKSPPAQGRVEIAYYTFPEYEGRGAGSRMAAALVKRARAADSSVLLIAQTLPEENPSTKILKRIGFAWDREVIHPVDGKVWEWRFPPA
jgi:RimJ/RimL family protein N-acetyltransferase